MTDDVLGTGGPGVLLLYEAGDERERIADLLADEYRVTATDDADAVGESFDLCILSRSRLDASRDRVRERRAESDSFWPVLLVVEGETPDAAASVWERVDDVVQLPVEEAVLAARVDNLLQRRRTADALADREAALRATVEDLRVKEQAIDQAPIGFTIADAADDQPLVYANDEFEALTGYDSEEILDRNCRFLQGEETGEEPRRQLREAIDEERPVSVDIVNYRRDGRRFWNKVDVAPLRDENGEVTHYVGFQADITHRKLRERRMEVLNRLLSHNLRNKMNVIQAYVEIIQAGDDPPGELKNIEAAASDLLAIAEAVRETDHVLSQTDPGDTVALGERLREIVDAVRDRHPAVTVACTLPDAPVTVAAGGLVAALREALENAAKHNDSDDPHVSVDVRRDGDWVDVTIEDDGPGIPEYEVGVLSEGESPLRHADRMGIWLIYWTVVRAGGTMSVENRDGGGSAISLSVPAAQS